MVPGVFQTRHDPLPDDAALQLGHRGDDREHRLAHGRGRVQRLLAGDEVDAVRPGSRQGKHQLPGAQGEAVKAPDHDDGELPAPGVGHEGIEAGAALFGSAGPV